MGANRQTHLVSIMCVDGRSRPPIPSLHPSLCSRPSERRAGKHARLPSKVFHISLQLTVNESTATSDGTDADDGLSIKSPSLARISFPGQTLSAWP